MQTFCAVGGIVEICSLAEPARPMGEATSVPYRLKEHFLAVRPNIAISIFTDDGADVGDPVKHAVSACIEAQSQNKLFLMYNRKIHEDAVLRMTRKWGFCNRHNLWRLPKSQVS